MTIAESASFISRVALKKETTSGTPEAAPSAYDYTDEISINAVQTMDKMNVIQDRNAICHIKSKYSMVGSFGIFGCPEGFLGHMLHGVMGSSATVQQGGTAAYKTTFTSINTVPSYTFWVKSGDVMETHIPYTVFNGLNFKQTGTEALKVTADIIGQKNAIIATYGTESFSGLCPFNHMEMSIAGSTAGQAVQTTDIDFSITNNINPDATRTVNDIFYNSLVCGKFDVNGSITMNFADDSEYQAFFGSSSATTPANTTDDIALEMVWTHSEEADTGYYYELVVTLPKVKYTLSDLDYSGEAIKQTITYEALYDSVSGYTAEVTLTNTESAGY